MEQEGIVLRNFQLTPQKIRLIKGSTVTLKVAENRRGYSRVYDEPRPFIFAIEELDIETPPLSDNQQFSFKIDKIGSFVLQCVNYSKLCVHIDVIEDTSSSSIKSSRSGSRESPTIDPPSKDPSFLNLPKPNSTFQFERYEDFASLVSSNFNRGDDMPEYLMNCFKRELSILQSTGDLENRQKREEVTVQEFKIHEEQEGGERKGELGEDKQKEQQEEGMENEGDNAEEIELLEQTTECSTPSKTFNEEACRFLRGKRWTPQPRPSNRSYYRKLLTVLQNRFSLGSYFQ